MTAEVKPKLSRRERNEDIRRKLFAAAVEVVGERGYEDASISRITERAGQAQGTFYNHFDSRQELFDQLLPAIGDEMIDYIRERVPYPAPAYAREIARFEAFFSFLDDRPGFLRILNEAEFSAPAGFRQHLDNMIGPYRAILRRARERGELVDFSDAEVEVIVHILMGARSYLGQRQNGSLGSSLPMKTLASAYAKLVTGGLFQKGPDNVGD